MSNIQPYWRRVVVEVKSLADRCQHLEHENKRLRADAANLKAHARRMERGRHAAEARLKAAGLLGPTQASGDAPALSV